MKRILLTMSVLLANSSGLSGQDDMSKISPSQGNLVEKVLLLSRAETNRNKLRWIAPDKFKNDPYWKAVFKLGETVLPQQKRALLLLERKNLEQIITLNASACVEQAERLESLVDRYKINTYTVPRKNGVLYRKLKDNHIAVINRTLWETLVLSPQIGQLGTKRCLEALSKCGDLGTFKVLREVRVRLVMGGAATKEIQEDIRSTRSVAASVVVDWVGFVEKIDAGGEVGLRELIYIIEFIENNFPNLNGFDRFKESPFYEPNEKGVTKYIIENVLLGENGDNETIWRNVISSVDIEKFSVRGQEIISSARRAFPKR